MLSVCEPAWWLTEHDNLIYFYILIYTLFNWLVHTNIPLTIWGRHSWFIGTWYYKLISRLTVLRMPPWYSKLTVLLYQPTSYPRLTELCIQTNLIFLTNWTVHTNHLFLTCRTLHTIQLISANTCIPTNLIFSWTLLMCFRRPALRRNVWPHRSQLGKGPLWASLMCCFSLAGT